MAGGSCIGDGQPCTCIAYEEEVTTDGRRCYECHHGKSRHCRAPVSEVNNSNPVSSNNTLVSNTGLDSLPNMSLLTRGSLGSNLTLLHELVHKPEGSTISTFGKPVSKDDARVEALRGFRPKHEEAESSRKVSGKTSKKEKADDKRQIVKISRIICYPYGMEGSDGHNTPYSTSPVFDEWVASGLATPVPDNLDQAIQFNKQYGSKQMNAIFRAALPLLFHWFGKINPQVLTVPDEPDDVGVPLNTIRWPYKVVSCSRNKLSLHKKPEHPTASFYYTKSASGNSNRPWSERIIHLISVDSIKETVWKKWAKRPPLRAPKPQAAGPSSSRSSTMTTRQDSKHRPSNSHHSGNSASDAIPLDDVESALPPPAGTKRRRSTAQATDSDDHNGTDSTAISSNSDSPQSPLFSTKKPKPRALSRRKKTRVNSPDPDTSLLSDTMEVIALNDNTPDDRSLSPDPTTEPSTSGRRVPSPPFTQLPMRKRLMATRSLDVMELSRSITNHWDADVSFEL